MKADLFNIRSSTTAEGDMYKVNGKVFWSLCEAVKHAKTGGFSIRPVAPQDIME